MLNPGYFSTIHKTNSSKLSIAPSPPPPPAGKHQLCTPMVISNVSQTYTYNTFLTNWYFPKAYTLVNKTVCVATSDVGLIANNLRVLKFCLLKYCVDKNAKFPAM